MSGRLALAAAAAQRRAAHPGKSVWVTASAGAGKTKVLTDRVLHLLLAGTPPERILCLTFTKAAAAEMAIRLGRRLGLWATQPEAALAEELRELSGESPDADMLAQARRLFARVLDAPGGLAIQTIHAFCQSVLRRFPLEAAIAPHFEVADERTAAEELRLARDEMLRHARAGDGGRLAAALARVTVRVAETSFDQLMRDLVGGRGRLDRLVARAGGTDALLPHLWKQLDLPADASEAAILTAACAAADEAALRRACRALAGGSAGDRERGDGIRAWLDDPQARVAGLRQYERLFLTAGGAVRQRLITKAAADGFPDAAAALAAEGERLVALREPCNAVATAEATAALLDLAFALVERYALRKRRRGLLDYDDLVLGTRALLADGAAGWVHYKLDGGIEHVLIDEAQDTNPDQWAVVEALAREFFAGDGARGPGRTVFAVGDRKQSIFSFQRADPERFEEMGRFFRALCEGAEHGWDDVALDVSFRSVPAVLRAVDAVFTGETAAGVLPEGAVLKHDPHRDGQAGLVELWPLIEPEPAAPPSPWEPARDYGARATPQGRLAWLIAERIRDWTDRGERLEARGRAIRPGDVMVLVRHRTGFIDQLVRALKARGVPVAGVDRMRLTDQLAVADLLALARFLLLPEDDLTLATVLKGPLVGLSEDELFVLAAGRKTSLWRRLGEAAAAEPGFAGARGALEQLLARADFLPPYELFAEVLGPRRGRERLLARLGAEANDPIDEFLAQALAYGRAHAPSLQGFVHWMEVGEGDVKRDLEQGGRDEVRIITVHGAKGLQAPIVILPDTTQLPQPVRPPFWTSRPDGDLLLWPSRKESDDRLSAEARAEAVRKQREEHRRLLYVAMTRAEDRLYVCGHRAGEREPDGECWYRLVEAGLGNVAEGVAFDFTEYGPQGWRGAGLRLAGRQSAPPKPDGRELPTAAEAGPPPDWLRRAAPADRPPRRPLAPSRAGKEEPPVSSPLGDGGARFRRGLLIHRLLQHLPELPAASRRQAARRYLEHAAADFAAAAREGIAAEVLAIIEDPEFAAVFAPGSRAEAPVAGAVGGVVVAGQLDRLWIGPSEILIVDYKSNRPAPRSAAEVPTVYLRQMAAYRALLAGIYADRPVRCALLWTEAPALMPLPADLLDAHRPSLDCPGAAA